MGLLLLFTVRACLPYPKILYFIHTCEKMWFLKGNTPPRRARWESSQKTFSIRKFIEFGRVPTRFKRNIFQTVSWKRDFFYAMSEKHFLLIRDLPMEGLRSMPKNNNRHQNHPDCALQTALICRFKLPGRDTIPIQSTAKVPRLGTIGKNHFQSSLSFA